ncbi:hypothetical protein S40288_06380 [Stachybotrys chartarum IBT 40288]|nr:hypothetical protein S40288_06380 [Stachybotrys chartarum IBT 40288]
MPTLLETLRTATQVDCDTMDHRVAHNLGPFVDCTSNQAIAYFELFRPGSKPGSLHHDGLIREAIYDARHKLELSQDEVTFAEFVVQVLMVKLLLQFRPNLTGAIHIQTNPKLAYSTKLTVLDAKRIRSIVHTLAEAPVERQGLCIKVPATWEGLQACRILETEEGIDTLATTMFCMEQAALAADAQCRYIAPYVNELKVHFEEGHIDHSPAFDFCRESQAYYLAHKHRTQVLAASLTSVEQVMQLAGIQHITVAPKLLQELSERDASSLPGEVGAYFAEGPDAKSWETRDYAALVRDESKWRLAFARSGFGASEGKIVQAINYFSDFQEKLEELVLQYLEWGDAE